MDHQRSPVVATRSDPAGPKPLGLPARLDDAPAAEALSRLVELLGYSHTILFALDLDLRVTWISEVDGMPREAVIGRRLGELLPSDEGEGLEDAARNVIATMAPLDLEPTVTWLGRPRTYATRVVPVVEGGRLRWLAVAITDVTELRQVERRERDARAALALAMHETGIRAFGADLERRVQWTAGLPEGWDARLVGHSVGELWPAAAAAEARAFAEVRAGAERATFDLEIEAPSGPEIHRIVLGPVRDGGVALTGFVATSTEITELRNAASQAHLKAAELELLVTERTSDLAASEERFRVSLDTTLDTLAIVSAVRDAAGGIEDFRIDYANPSWRSVYGHGVERAAGLMLYRDFPYFRSRRAMHLEAVTSGSAVRETVEAPGDRGTRLFDFQLTPFGDGFVVASRDVTERMEAERRLRESERRLRDTIAGIDAIVWDEDVRTGDFWISPQAEAILGYAASEWDADPRLWLGIVVPEDRERVAEVLDGDESADIEYTAAHKDGTHRLLRDRLTVIKDGSGAVVRRYGLTIDITSIRRLEARAFSAERLDALGRFAGQIAHDVDNILYGVGIFARYAREAVQEGGDPQPDLDRVIEGLERGSALTGSLLDFARSRPGRLTRLDLVPVVKSFLPILERLADPAVTLDVELEPGPLVAVADRAAIEQVLLNLATNALQAMPSGGRLTVELRQVRLAAAAAKTAGVARGTYAELVVQDTGMGMDAATLARVGEPFFTTRADGTGLGLPSVFGIVSTHRGAVDVTSTLGEGTRFRVLLPTTV
ncbi:MAG: PAS domain-containing protein [Chloroflexota bacterium]